MATKTRKELEAENQARYNAATSGSQSISDYLASNGVKSDGSYTDKSTGKYYTTVTESNGSKSNGYIKDGVSYYTNGTPINAGASVTDSTGKTWTKGGSSVKEVEEDIYNPYEDQIERYKKAYEDLEAQIRERNRLAVEQGTNRLNAQKSNINQAADENARQAYVQYMQSQKALPQQLASQGVSGGATETANLGLQTTYQNNVNAINQNKANRLQEIDNAIVDLQNTGDLSTVEQVLANNQAALDAYMNTFDKGVGYNQWANTFNASRADANREYEAQQLQAYLDAWEEQNKLLAEEKKENQKYKYDLYKNGHISREEFASEFGYDPEILYDTMGYLTKENELALKDKQMDINNTQSQISNRTSVSSGGTKTNQTYAQVLKAIQDLNTTSGADYTENLASARYLLNSDLNMNDVISVMKQTNVRPEMFVKQMVDEGLSEQDVVDFIEAYTPKQDYRDALYRYAYN